MADDFFIWLIESAERLKGEAAAFMENVCDAVKEIVAWILAIILFPIWGIPFLYWYFKVWNKREGEEEHEEISQCND